MTRMSRTGEEKTMANGNLNWITNYIWGIADDVRLTPFERPVSRIFWKMTARASRSPALRSRDGSRESKRNPCISPMEMISRNVLRLTGQT
jgi:hypothetical protein